MPLFSRHVFALSLLLLGTALGGGCAGEADEEAEDRQVYRARGRLLGTADEGRAAVIRHDSIPGYMAPMTMSFRLEDPAALDGLATGDSVAFDLVVTGGTAVITTLEKLPTGSLRAPQDTSRL